AQAERARLDELRLRAAELRGEALLALGRDDRALLELRQLVAAHPERERPRGTLMLGLYRGGRQAEALALFRDGRRHLIDEHGIEPGSALRELHQAILVQDPRLDRSPPPPVAPLPPRLRHHGGQPFVGRAAERAALDAALDRVGGGERLAVLLSGEPGIGKTRLAVELAGDAAARGFTPLAGRCDEDLGRSFQPFEEALGALADRLPDELLAAHAREHGDVLARLLPPLAERLRQLGAGAEAGGADVAIAGAGQYALFAAVGDLLARLGDTAPLLLVLEDLQWADRPTLLLLKHLLTTPAHPRMLVLATHRADEPDGAGPLADLLAELHREPAIVRLELEGLRDDEVAELVATAETPLLPAAVRALARGTGGNPFFLTELLRTLGEAPEGELPAAALGDAAPGERLPLPGGVRETISRRVRRLGEPTTQALGGAAVLGVEFDPRLLPRVLGADPERVALALARARAAGLVGDAAAGLAFRHALIAQTLYEELPEPERMALHRRAAEALEALPPAATAREAPALARHWTVVRDPSALERAIHWCRVAGQQALAQLAPQRAQRWFEQALALLAKREEATDEERCAILIELGAAQRHSGDPSFRETLLDAARIALRRGDDERLVRAALGNTRGFVSSVGGADGEVIAVIEAALATVGPERTAVRARLLATLGGELSFSSDWTRRAALSDEALAIAREVGDPGALVHVLTERNITIWRPETLEERLANTDECLRAADLLGDPIAQFHALHWRASACVTSGLFTEARATRARARALAARIRQPTALWMTAYDDADELIVAGRLADAERRALEAGEIGQASGQPDAPLILASQLVVIRHDQGRLSELTELIAQTLELNPRLTGYRSVLALGYCEQGSFEDAARILAIDAPDRFAGLAADLTWLSVACTYAHIAARLIPAGAAPRETGLALRDLLAPWHGQIAYIGPAGGRLVAHHLGMLLLALGELDEARVQLEAAVRRADALPAPVWAARARLELARCLLAQGEEEAALALLARTRRDAEELGADGIAAGAAELLGGLTPAAGAAPSRRGSPRGS
ncbi:MAG TPA: BTAD domain-containing putative transcriptional regulator, partial [Kofleriaceae bacterium]